MIPEIDKLEKRLIELDDQREKVLYISRELIRSAGKSITAMHTGNVKKAKIFLEELNQRKKELEGVEKGFEYNALQAHQEYVEALLLYHILKEGKVPSFKEMHEGEQAYLLGMMDVIGELKREAFELMRNHEIAKAKKLYSIMLEMYDSTMHMKFANALLPDFRKKQDVARIQLESVSQELLMLESREKN